MSSRQRLENYTLYLDRNLGKHIIANALREASIEVEVHDDHLASDAPDEEWIALVGECRWVALTKDKNIRYRFAEIEAIRGHKARVIVIRAKSTTGEEIAEILVNHSNRIQRFAVNPKAPFVAGIDRNGKITRYLID